MKKIQVTSIKNESSKILKDNVRIMFLSDIHYKKGFNQQKLVLIKKVVEELKPLPDVILIGGDLLDDTKTAKEDLKNLKEFIKTFAVTYEIPTVISTGNHDLMTKNDKVGIIERLNPNRKESAWLEFVNKEWLNELQDTPNTYVLQTLKNHTVHFENLGVTVGEVPLPYSHYEEDKESIDSFLHFANQAEYSFKNSEYNILLSHTPNALCQQQVQNNLGCADLVAEAYTGHNHGGLAPRWFNRISMKGLKGWGFINPQMKKLAPYCAGKIEGIKFPVIISTGISRMNMDIIDNMLKPEIIIEDIKRKRR